MSAQPNISSLGFIGRYFLDGCYYLVEIATIIYISIKAFFTLKRGERIVSNKILYRKIYMTIRNTSGIIGIVSFILGALVVIQITTLNIRMGIVGNIFDTVIIKELGPLLTAIIVVGRSATFITTEIGTMKKTEELTAFKVMGIEPNNYVIMPRVIGVTIALLVLVLFFDICCVCGGLVMSLLMGSMSAIFYLQNILSQLSFVDIFGTILKALVPGLLLTSISCYEGFAIKGSLVEIPHHVAKSFVSSLFFCFLCNFGISYFLYV